MSDIRRHATSGKLLGQSGNWSVSDVYLMSDITLHRKFTRPSTALVLQSTNVCVRPMNEALSIGD